MSEKELINDEIIFQSFSKSYIFDSNREPNKASQNENIEFTFKKNLFVQKSEESPSKTSDIKNSNNNKMSPFNEKDMNIYSKNDNNLQESGHFGKSKYDSNKYKNIIKEDSIFNKQPLFFIGEKISGNYSKPNLNIKKLERAELKPFDNKLKKSEIRKYKSGVKINSLKNIKNDNYTNNRNKKKKIKDETSYSLKVSNLNIKENHKKKSKNHLIEEINNMERKTSNNCRNDPVLKRMKKMKENNYYKEMINNTFNRTHNNKHVINTQIIENEIKPINNYLQFIHINGFINNNKIKKIPTGRYIDIQPKLKTNIDINNTTKQISRNTRICKENKENISININNTIMNCSQKQPIYISEIKPINLINYRPSFNLHKIFNSKNRNDKRENMVQISAENYLKLKNEIHPISKNNFGLNNNLENLIKNNLATSNKNKNIDSYLCNKLNTINNDNKAFKFTKIKRTNISRDIISKKKLMVKSYVMKNNFEF